jgi:hypothetical protein
VFFHAAQKATQDTPAPRVPLSFKDSIGDESSAYHALSGTPIALADNELGRLEKLND